MYQRVGPSGAIRGTTRLATNRKRTAAVKSGHLNIHTQGGQRGYLRSYEDMTSRNITVAAIGQFQLEIAAIANPSRTPQKLLAT